MSEVTLFESKNLRGYSVTLHGDIVPENGYYNFASLIVGARTEVTLFDKNNSLITIHNGSTGIVKIVNIYATNDVPEDVPITLKIRKIPKDNSSYLSSARTGAVVPLTPHVTNSSCLLVVIVLCVIIYLAFVKWDLFNFVKNELGRKRFPVQQSWT